MHSEITSNITTLKNSRGGHQEFQYSLEALSGDIPGLADWAGGLAPGIRVFLPHFNNHTLDFRLVAAQQLRMQGLIPVAHLAARKINRQRQLPDLVARYLAGGVDEFLLVGGDGPPGPECFTSVSEMLATGIFYQPGVKAVGVAGHPEAHPHQAPEIMQRALRAKLAQLSKGGTPSFIVTQFCFSAAPYLEFLDWLQREQYTVPVSLGLPGAVGTPKLFRFITQAGWLWSFNYAVTHFGRCWGLLKFSPETLLAQLTAELAQRHYDFPVHFHFYPFGALKKTLALTQTCGHFFRP